MLHRPRFNPHIQVEKVDGEGVFLLWETGQAVLQGRVYELLAALIDGRRTSDEIIERLQGEDSAPLYYGLAKLEDRGYLIESDDVVAPGVDALWSIQGIAPRLAACRLGQTTVSVAAVGGIDPSPFLSALGAMGVRVGKSEKLAVVLTDDYLRVALRAHNDEALAHARPWLLARPVGCQLWVGPVFRPGKTACWECLARRLRTNRPADCYVALQKLGQEEPAPVALASTSASLQAAANLIANEVASWVVRGESEREGTILTLDLLAWKTQTHTLVRQTDCHACGGTEFSSRPGEPMVLQSGQKKYTRDGGHRVVSSEATLERFGHHVSPLTGIVTGLTRCGPPSDGVLHVYESGQNLTKTFHDLADLHRGMRSGKSGKGASDSQARASALCEGLERHCGIFRGDEPRRRARLTDLGDSAVHPNACMLFSDKQYRDRDRWNARETRYNYVLFPLAEDAEIDWTPVWSLTRREPRYLPTAYCYYNFADPEVPPFAVTCSNGTAAGNTLEEAILQGFLELVERDNVALWWYNRLCCPGVDLESFSEPYLNEVREFLRSRNRNLWALDLTADLGIPVFAALSCRLDRLPERILLGFGAHLEARVALLRAVTELNQMLAWVIPMESDPPEPLEDWESKNWLRTATTANQPYILPAVDMPQRRMSDYPRRWHDDLRDDLLLCQSLVEENRMELLVLDQTRLDVGLPVVKVFVPGLRHFWARFAPGRLYEVPMKLGRLTRQLDEKELNPIPMFI
jgi:bacteriocin biosynthesis cyclodehydratase domain-containing protein